MVVWSSISPATNTASWSGSTMSTRWSISALSAPIDSMTRSMHKRSDGGTMMNITPIRTEADYRAALADIETLMLAEANTPEGDRLDVLVTLVEAYERQHFPLELPDAVEAIKFVMEQRGLGPKDLEPMIGRRNRVYEVLNRTRPLTLNMIRRLNEHLVIPAEALMNPPSRQEEHRRA